MNNTFEKVCIVGLGLIGGSIGLAIKRSNISNQITGYARSNSTLERAIELGLVDSVKDNLKDDFKDNLWANFLDNFGYNFVDNFCDNFVGNHGDNF